MPRIVTATRLAAFALAALLASGCTAGIATARLVSADKMLREAHEAGADVHAPYAYNLAELYLDKAVEQSSRSQFKVSMDLARQAEAFATKALEEVAGTRRIDLENVGDDIQEQDLERPAPEDDGRKAGELDDETFDEGADEEDDPFEVERDEEGDTP